MTHSNPRMFYANIYFNREVWVKTQTQMGVLVGKSVEKPPLIRHRHGWEYNIKVDLKRIRWGGVNSINLAQDRHKRRGVLNVIMRHGVP